MADAPVLTWQRILGRVCRVQYLHLVCVCVCVLFLLVLEVNDVVHVRRNGVDIGGMHSFAFIFNAETIQLLDFGNKNIEHLELDALRCGGGVVRPLVLSPWNFLILLVSC